LAVPTYCCYCRASLGHSLSLCPPPSPRIVVWDLLAQDGHAPPSTHPWQQVPIGTTLARVATLVSGTSELLAAVLAKTTSLHNASGGADGEDTGGL